MKAIIQIRLKNGVLDPQGRAIETALEQLEFSGINQARQGKLIELDLAETDKELAYQQTVEICEKLLANKVIENYDITLES